MLKHLFEVMASTVMMELMRTEESYLPVEHKHKPTRPQARSTQTQHAELSRSPQPNNCLPPFSNSAFLPATTHDMPWGHLE